MCARSRVTTGDESMTGPQQITRVQGSMLPMRGDDIDTDRILPARYLRAVTFTGIEAYLFEDERRDISPEGRIHPFADPRFNSARVLVVERNFACGSSREHAPQAIQRRGIGVVLGESFSEIFFGNSVAIGMPCLRMSSEAIAKLMRLAEDDPTLVADVDIARLKVRTGGSTFDATMPASAQEAFTTGSWDATGLLLEGLEQTRQVASRLPYVSGF